MKTIKAERITKDNFAPYGRYYNVFEAVSYTHLTLPTILLV